MKSIVEIIKAAVDKQEPIEPQDRPIVEFLRQMDANGELDFLDATTLHKGVLPLARFPHVRKPR